MARPRQFDRDDALARATRLFWDKGYAASSTDLLLKEMGLGRQSLYNAFGGKRELYLEALRAYQQGTLADHLTRLQEPDSPLDGLRQLLRGIAVPDDAVRALGCLGVGAVEEFGTSDAELSSITAHTDRLLLGHVRDRVVQGQSIGEIDPALDAGEAARFVLMSMTGLQVAARGGADLPAMHVMADFAVDRLRAG